MDEDKMVEVIIDLELELYEQLKEMAEERGVPVEQLVADIITEYVELELVKEPAPVVMYKADYEDLVTARKIVIEHYEKIDPELNPIPKWGIDNLLAQYDQYKKVRPYEDEGLTKSLKLKKEAEEYARIEYYDGEDLDGLSREDYRNVISILCGRLAAAKTLYSR
jgi:hypothetical protein